MTEKYELQVYPSPILKERAAIVTAFPADLKEKTDAMLEIMYENNGIGLAGNQMGIAQRIVVADLSPDKNEPRVFINPELLDASAERESNEEGCLSFPEIYEPVMRAKSVIVKYQDLEGVSHEEEMFELLGRCLQHE